MRWLDKLTGKDEMIKNLDHVAIVVGDMDRAIAVSYTHLRAHET